MKITLDGVSIAHMGDLGHPLNDAETGDLGPACQARPAYRRSAKGAEGLAGRASAAPSLSRNRSGDSPPSW